MSQRQRPSNPLKNIWSGAVALAGALVLLAVMIGSCAHGCDSAPLIAMLLGGVVLSGAVIVAGRRLIERSNWWFAVLAGVGLVLVAQLMNGF